MNGQPSMAMNPATGGPVGGPQMNQMPQQMLNPQARDELLTRFNTYIYDHFLKTQQYDIARSFKKANPIRFKNDKKPNGVSSEDSKDGLKRPDDLPEPDCPPHIGELSFLLDWFCMFWDTFNGRRSNPTYRNMMPYLSQQRLRQDMMQTNGDQKMMNMRLANMNGMKMMQNRTPQQMQQSINQQKMMGAAMQRDPSNMEMGGQRPQTPSGMDNAPSPSKKPRLDGGFDGQGMQPGNRPMGNPHMGTPVMNSGMGDMPGFPGGPNMAKIEGMAQSSGLNPQMELESYVNQRIPQPNGAAPGGEGRHALQDYQMQLMLLEQQNKKRLLQARREQENISGANAGNGTIFAPSMSPSGSRGAGPSPNPADQMRRVGGTPKMAQQGLPGSPMNDMQRNSPGAPNLDPSNGQIPQGMPQQYYNQMQMNRPPSSHPNFNQMGAGMGQPIDAMRMAAANGGRMPGSPWPPGAQGLPNAGNQPGPAAIGTPQQRTGNMPPPPAPSDQTPTQRGQESSPAQPAAPPTPSQQAKAAPKKKETAAQKKKNAPKKQGSTTAATPASESADQPTPQPSTPITPMNRESFSKGGHHVHSNASQPSATSSTIDTGNSFTLGVIEESGGLNFGEMHEYHPHAGVDLENFDFDSFLASGDDGLNFDANFGAEIVETEAGL